MKSNLKGVRVGVGLGDKFLKLKQRRRKAEQHSGGEVAMNSEIKSYSPRKGRMNVINIIEIFFCHMKCFQL